MSVTSADARRGGFLTRTELSGGAAGGLNSNYAYTANVRLVLDFTGKLWKTRLLGIGASYFRGRTSAAGRRASIFDSNSEE